MNFIKNSKILLIFILVISSCYDNETNRDKRELENLLLKFHMKHSPSKKLEKGINLLISKNINLEYNALFYKIKNSNNFYLGFIDNHKNIIKVIKLKRNENISMFDNNLCIIKPEESDNNDCFTFFIGEIPFEGYSNIELEWNCSKKSLSNEKLINKKYYFFLKKGLKHNICNIKLIDSKGQTENLTYNIENGLFKKSTTTNNVYN